MSFDSQQSGERTSAMWLKLAEQLEAAVPDYVIAGDPVRAIAWACCAEACFWKATGEADAHDIKDVLGMNAASSSHANQGKVT
jgi:hypothetical protein